MKLIAQLQLFLLFLFFFLVADILTYHVRIQANTVNTVSFGPKVVAPIGLFLQVSELLEELHRRLPFQPSQQIGYRQLWRDHHHHVYVVRLDIELYYLATSVTANCHYPVFCGFFYCPMQYAVPILRHPYDVILTMPYRM